MIDSLTYFVAEIFNNAKGYAQVVFTSACILIFAELLIPQSRYSAISRIRAGIFWLTYIALNATGYTLFFKLWAMLGIQPVLNVDVDRFYGSSNGAIHFIGAVLMALLIMQVGEFFYYWYHRLQHNNRYLWKMHAVHHSIRELNALNSYHHWLEEITRIPFVVIPAGLLIHFQQSYTPWIWASIVSLQPLYEHSATKISLGWFRYILPDNRYHRLHHSIEPRHHNRNFGSASALWDFMFGTLTHPEKNHWPEVGLAHIPEPLTLKEYVFRPFMKTK